LDRAGSQSNFGGMNANVGIILSYCCISHLRLRPTKTLVQTCGSQPIRSLMVTTAGMIKQENVIKFRAQSLHNVDAVFELWHHVVVPPASLIVRAVFEFDNERRLGEWLFICVASPCLFCCRLITALGSSPC
jgi:hypothetical protein